MTPLSQFVEHSSSDLQAWAAAQFAGIDLGHTARTKRAVRIAVAMAQRAGASIPNLFDSNSDIKASCTFFEHPRSTLDAIEQHHRAVVLAEARRVAGLVLLIEESSEVSCSHRRRRVEGLGSIGSG